MDIAEALLQLGVRDGALTQAERAALDRDGFLRFERVLTASHVSSINARLDELIREEGDEAGKELHQEPGAARVADLINKGEMFHLMFTHPRVLSAVAQVLEGDVKLSTLNSRASLPGHGHQALHVDGGVADAAGKFPFCNSIWLLDDFTPENGATRIVPGSHRLHKKPADAMSDPAAQHSDEILLLGNAGDVVVFNSSCWHGGTLNRSAAPRRSITAYYCRRSAGQATDQRKHLRAATRERLSDAALLLIDAL